MVFSEPTHAVFRTERVRLATPAYYRGQQDLRPGIRDVHDGTLTKDSIRWANTVVQAGMVTSSRILFVSSREPWVYCASHYQLDRELRRLKDHFAKKYGYTAATRIRDPNAFAMRMAPEMRPGGCMTARALPGGGAVSKILSRLEQRALEELVDRVERQKARQTLRLDYLYWESLRAWDASKTDATRRVQRKTDRGPGTPGATVAQLVVETQHGDPRYLELARKALADQRTLWGLDAPQKLDVRASQGPFVRGHAPDPGADLEHEDRNGRACAD